MEYEDQKEIRDLIFSAVKTYINKPVEKKVLTYQGFDVVVPARMIPKQPSVKTNESEQAENKVRESIPWVFVKRNGTYYMEIESLQGITKRLNNLLEDLPKAKIRREGVLETLQNKKSILEAELAKKGESYATQIAQFALELEEIDKQLGVVA